MFVVVSVGCFRCYLIPLFNSDAVGRGLFVAACVFFGLGFVGCSSFRHHLSPSSPSDFCSGPLWVAIVFLNIKIHCHDCDAVMLMRMVLNGSLMVVKSKMRMTGIMEWCLWC